MIIFKKSTIVLQLACLFFIILGILFKIPAEAAADAGDTCSINSDCDSGSCQSSICIGKKTGEACSDSDQCTTGQCENSFCVCDDIDKTKSVHCENTLYGGYGGTASGWKCMDSDQDPDSFRGEWNFCKKEDYTSSLPKTSTADVKYPVEKKILMGYACDDHDACLSQRGGYHVCDSTTIASTVENDPWFVQNKELKVCNLGTIVNVAPENTIQEVCTQQYGDGTWVKVDGTGDLSGLKVCQNTAKNNIIPKTLKEMQSSVATSDISGTSATVNTTFLGFDISVNAPELVTPETKIKIPGVVFSNITKESHITTDESGASWLNIPFLGEFISAIYKYSVGLISLIAVMVLIISGVQIITSAGNSEAISSAKHRIVSSVIAIIITAGSYTILYTVNPDLVNLKNLKILVIQGETLEIHEESDLAIQNLPTDAQGNVINTITNTGGIITGADGVVTKRPASINEITAEQFMSEKINGQPSDGWAIWQTLSPTEKNTILPHLFIRTGQCTNAEAFVKSNIEHGNLKNLKVHPNIIPKLRTAADTAEKYDLMLYGTAFRTLDDETRLWNTGVVARFTQTDQAGVRPVPNWAKNQGAIAKPGCEAPHSSGGAMDLYLKRGNVKVTKNGPLMNNIGQATAYYSSTNNDNVYNIILEQIMHQSGWVRYCQETWHFETEITKRYSKWTDRNARCVMHWDNWIIPIPNDVKQKANTLAPGIFP